MDIEYKKLDTLDINFEIEFSPYEATFYKILSKSYSIYYGKEYHESRIKNGQAILYFGFVDNLLVAVSYVKRNKRRGGIAVYPEKFRRLGIAKKLVELSLIDFPKQYTILSTSLTHSYKMLELMKNAGFKMASTEREIQDIVGSEFKLLSYFRIVNGNLIFDRQSKKRDIRRESLTLVHTF